MDKLLNTYGSDSDDDDLTTRGGNGVKINPQQKSTPPPFALKTDKCSGFSLAEDIPPGFISRDDKPSGFRLPLPAPKNKARQHSTISGSLPRPKSQSTPVGFTQMKPHLAGGIELLGPSLPEEERRGGTSYEAGGDAGAGTSGLFSSRISSFLPAPKHSLGMGAMALGGGSSASGGRKRAMEIGSLPSGKGEELNNFQPLETRLPTHEEVPSVTQGAGYSEAGPHSSWAQWDEYGEAPRTSAEGAGRETNGYSGGYSAGYAEGNWHSATTYQGGAHPPESSPYPANIPAEPGLHYDTTTSQPIEIANVTLPLQQKRRRRDEEAMASATAIEVRQEDLTKGAVKEHQMRSTGIAFGPAYQPSSSKSDGSKTGKLQRRKHQIGTLYSDMKKKEMELVERRSKGMLTKAQTHAKYGW